MRGFASGAVLTAFIVAFFVWWSVSHPDETHPRLTKDTVYMLRERYPNGTVEANYFKVCINGGWWHLYEDGDQHGAFGSCWR